MNQHQILPSGTIILSTCQVKKCTTHKSWPRSDTKSPTQMFRILSWGIAFIWSPCRFPCWATWRCSFYCTDWHLIVWYMHTAAYSSSTTTVRRACTFVREYVPAARTYICMIRYDTTWQNRKITAAASSSKQSASVHSSTRSCSQFAKYATSILLVRVSISQRSVLHHQKLTVRRRWRFVFVPLPWAKGECRSVALCTFLVLEFNAALYS